MVRILGSLLALFVALLIVFLLGSSFLISSDLKRGDLFDKYRNDRSFLYSVESGQTCIFATKAIAQAHRYILHGAYASVHAWESWVDEWAINSA